MVCSFKIQKCHRFRSFSILVIFCCFCFSMILKMAKNRSCPFPLLDTPLSAEHYTNQVANETTNRTRFKSVQYNVHHYIIVCPIKIYQQQQLVYIPMKMSMNNANWVIKWIIVVETFQFKTTKFASMQIKAQIHFIWNMWIMASRRNSSNSKAIDDDDGGEDVNVRLFFSVVFFWLFISICFNYFNSHRPLLLHTNTFAMWKLNIVRSIDINSETQYDGLVCVCVCVCLQSSRRTSNITLFLYVCKSRRKSFKIKYSI